MVFQLVFTVFGAEKANFDQKEQRKGHVPSYSASCEAKDHEAHVEEIDKKLSMLREQYKAVEDGRLESFAGVVVSERLKARSYFASRWPFGRRSEQGKRLIGQRF